VHHLLDDWHDKIKKLAEFQSPTHPLIKKLTEDIENYEEMDNANGKCISMCDI